MIHIHLWGFVAVVVIEYACGFLAGYVMGNTR